MQKISGAGVALIAEWEEFVGYVYDDLVPKRGGKYPEWSGGPVKGTLTIGYGHTNAAGAPKIRLGMRITEKQGSAMLADDLAPVERDVRRIVKVKLSQPQYDALCSFCFNEGPDNLIRLTRELNRGNYADIPPHMLLYVYAKGRKLKGLVNRRNAEIALWKRVTP